MTDFQSVGPSSNLGIRSYETPNNNNSRVKPTQDIGSYKKKTKTKTKIGIFLESSSVEGDSG